MSYCIYIEAEGKNYALFVLFCLASVTCRQWSILFLLFFVFVGASTASFHRGEKITKKCSTKNYMLSATIGTAISLAMLLRHVF